MVWNTAGCGLTGRRTVWRKPVMAKAGGSPGAVAVRPGQAHAAMRPVLPDPATGQAWQPGVDPAAAIAAAEAAYARGDALRQKGAADCVDAFYQTAASSWQFLESYIATSSVGTSSSVTAQYDANFARGWRLYHSGLARLIETGQQYKRLDATGGLTVDTASGPLHIPVVYHGFAWGPEDFNRLVPVGDYKVPDLSHVHRQRGLGVALVVERQRQVDERFHLQQQRFAATVVLRPGVGEPGMKLELHDPLRVSKVQVAGRQLPLDADITAPFALGLATMQRDYFQEFLRPGAYDGEAKLLMLEPYQPGKIPLVFVHGLLSDPQTWIELANELRAHDDLIRDYQIWAFQYPTGEPFLRSAATLRTELQAAVDALDPQCQDPALRQMVLIGHSMGGLIAKLQVTFSDDAIWQSVAKVPLERIVATPTQRERLAELCYFQPSAAVKRVVFIGTPHNGSSQANRLIGRLGASLVRQDARRQADHQELIQRNPNVFAPFVRKRIPPSVDLLEPGNPILASMQRLRIGPEVKLHSIIGNGRPMLLGGPADGVVPVSSARHSGVESERLVPTKHSGIHRHPMTVEEILGILRRHKVLYATL